MSSLNRYYHRLGTQFYERCDYLNALENFMKSIKSDAVSVRAESHYYLGLLYKKKSFVKFDEVKARDHLLLSGKMGYGKSYFILGLMYEKGLGRISKNLKKTVTYYTQGAQLNDPDCLLNLGVIYDEGKGVKPNQSKSFEYFKRGASLGDIDANFNLALMYENGEFVRKNINKAMRHYCDAGLYPNPERIQTVEYVDETQLKRCHHTNNHTNNHSFPNTSHITHIKTPQSQLNESIIEWMQNK